MIKRPRKIGRSSRIALVTAFVLGCAALGKAQSITVDAYRNFVANECGGDWNRVTNASSDSKFNSGVINGYAGTLSTYPKVSTVADTYEDYYGGWFRTNHRVGSTVYSVDVFSRVQSADLSKAHQNFVRVNSNADNYLAWHQYFNISKSTVLSHPIWSGQTYDILTPQSLDLHARWRCGMRYPANGEIRFNAMHELWINSSSGKSRIQVEMRQSSNQGTTAPNSKYLYTCPTYGSRFYVNGFTVRTSSGAKVYDVWTFTLEKTYDPRTIYDGRVNLSRMVHFLRANPWVWPGAGFPADGSINRVETGVEVWYGSDGSQFTSYVADLWRQ